MIVDSSLLISHNHAEKSMTSSENNQQKSIFPVTVFEHVLYLRKNNCLFIPLDILITTDRSPDNGISSITPLIQWKLL
jgi:hypothetical protein